MGRQVVERLMLRHSERLRRLPLRPSRRLLRGRFLRLLFAGDRHQHFLLPGCRLPRLFGRLLRGLGLGRCAADALAQRVHQINDVLAARPFHRPDRLARTLAVDQGDERRLIVVLEFFRYEVLRCTSPGFLMAAG